MPPQNYAIAVEGIRKDAGLEIPGLREISKKLGNEVLLKTFRFVVPCIFKIDKMR
jgi:hypothetical protein